MTTRKLPPLPLTFEHWETIARGLRLPRQERRIAELILRHQCDKQIAANMGIAYPTVRTYIRRLFDRLGVADREELILLVFRLAQAPSHRSQ